MIVIAFYVVPFITSWGRLLQEGSIERVVAIMEFYFVFYFFFLSCFSCASFYYWCCYIPFEKCLLRIFFLYFLFFLLFLGISLWLFVLIQALLVSI